MRVRFATQSYVSRSLPLSAQRLVNLYAEAAPPDAKTPVALFGTPGLKSFATLGDGPIRGLQVMDHVLYAASGGKVYAVDPFPAHAGMKRKKCIRAVPGLADSWRIPEREEM